MNRGQNRATLFADDGDFAYFVGLLARYSGRFSFLHIGPPSLYDDFVAFQF
jgi:hypothetical protein